MAESEEELKSFLMKVKEKSEKAGLKLSIENTKIMASGPITLKFSSQYSSLSDLFWFVYIICLNPQKQAL